MLRRDSPFSLTPRPAAIPWLARFVLAAWSPSLAAGLGLRLPVQGGKGYHVDLEPGDGDTAMPLWFAERRTVATPLPRGLRLTGMLQLAGTDLSIDHRRVDTILANGRQLLTGLADRHITSVWRGLRPCSPDGLPIVGRAPSTVPRRSKWRL